MLRLDGGALGYWAIIETIHAIYDRAGVARPPKAALPAAQLRDRHGPAMSRSLLNLGDGRGGDHYAAFDFDATGAMVFSCCASARMS
jgi:hypothetical protein